VRDVAEVEILLAEAGEISPGTQCLLTDGTTIHP
jgi:hypothetical protein